MDGWERAAPRVERVLGGDGDGTPRADALAAALADLADVDADAARRALARAACDAGVTTADRVEVLVDGEVTARAALTGAGVGADDGRAAALDRLDLAALDDPARALAAHLDAHYDEDERRALADHLDAVAFDRAVADGAALDPRPGVDDPASLARALASRAPVDEGVADVAVRTVADGPDPDRSLAAFLGRGPAVERAAAALRAATDPPTLSDLLAEDEAHDGDPGLDG